MLSHVVFVSLLALASQVTATTVSPRTIHQLLTRQTSGFDPSVIPAACQSDCSIIVSAIANCQPPAAANCGCSTTVEAGFITCLNCLLNLNGAPSPSQVTGAQNSVDQYVSLCRSAGVPLPATAVSGATPGPGNAPSSVIISATGNTPIPVSSTAFPTGNTFISATTSAFPTVTFISASSPAFPTSNTLIFTPTPVTPQQSTFTGLPSTSSSAPPGAQNSALRAEGRGTTAAVAVAVFAVIVFF